MKNFTLRIVSFFSFFLFFVITSHSQANFTADESFGDTILQITNIDANITVDRDSPPGGPLSHVFTLSSGVWNGTDNGTVTGGGTATLKVEAANTSRITINDGSDYTSDLTMVNTIAMFNTRFIIDGMNDVSSTAAASNLAFNNLVVDATSINFVTDMNIGCFMTSFTATGNISLAGVNGSNSSMGNGCAFLIIDTPATTTLTGKIEGFGGIGLLRIQGGGNTILDINDPNAITAFREVSFGFGETVELRRDTKIESSIDNITFTGDVNGNFRLDPRVNNNQSVLFTNVGNSVPLQKIENQSFGSFSFTTGIVRTQQSLEFDIPISIINAATTTTRLESIGGNIVFNNALRGFGAESDLVLNAANINFNATANPYTGLRNVTVNNAPATVSAVTFNNPFTVLGNFLVTATQVNVNESLITTSNGNQVFSALGGGNITFGTNGKIQSGATGSVNLNATSGSIINIGTNAKVQSLTLNMVASAGIGAIDPLRTQVSNIRFNNTFDQTNITNNGLVFISGNSNLGQGGQLEAAGNIGVNASVSASEDFTINSTNGSLTVNSNVTHFGIGFPRNMSLLADGDIIFSAGLVSFNTPQTADELVITASNGIIDKTSTGNSPVISAFIVKPTAQNGIGVTNPITTGVSNIVFINTNNAVQVTEANDISIAGQNGTGQTNFTTLAGNIAFNNFNSISGIETNGPITLNASGFIRGNVPSGLNVSGTNLSMTAANGIGNNNPIETNVDAITYLNTTSNRVQIIEADGATITGSDTASGAFDDVRATTGNIDVIAPGISSASLLFLGVASGNNVTTPLGIPTSAIFSATNETQLGGGLQPGGNAIGVTNVQGNLRLNAIPVAIAINDNDASGSSAGIDYDAITSTGTVTLGTSPTQATLTVTDLGSTALGSEILTIISAASVSGTFAGLPDGATISVGSNTFVINYTANTVTLTLQENIFVSGGNLIIQDIGNIDDDLTIVIDDTNYRISDANNSLVGGNGTTIDGSDILVPIASITGNTILVDTKGGDDNFTVDFSGGNFNDAITYNGGTQVNGDAMALIGGGTFASQIFTFTNENDGNVSVSGNQDITYTGLEPITSTINAQQVRLDYSNTSETITITDAGAGQTTVDSDVGGEIVTFNNPTMFFRIEAGDVGVNTFNFNSLAANFPANIAFVGGDGGDIINMNGAMDLSADKVLNLNARTINFPNATSTITARGTGSLTIVATDNITMPNGFITSENGDISIRGNGNDAATIGNFTGIAMSNSITTTGSGSIFLRGRGLSDDGSHSSRFGILIQPGSTIEATGTGGINVSGLGGIGMNANRGIEVRGPNTTIRTVDGTLEFFARGRGTGNNNYGMRLLNATADTTGDGLLFINAAGADGDSVNNGLQINNTTLQSVHGNMSITANGGDGTGFQNRGLFAFNSSIIRTTGTGTITIDAIGGTGTNLNYGLHLANGTTVSTTNSSLTINATGGNGMTGNSGIFIVDPNSEVSTVNGAISLNGIGGNGSGNENNGIRIQNAAVVKASGTGTVSFIGNAGTGVNENKGVYLTGTGTEVTTASGTLEITGTGNTATTGNANFGIHLFNNAIAEAVTSGEITMNGTAGSGTNNNEGIRVQNIGSVIRTNGGGLNLTGTGGNGSTQANIGVFLLNGGLIEDTANGAINITGYGGDGSNENKGIVLFGNSSILRTNGGGLTLNGFASTTAIGINNSGVSIEQGTVTDLDGGAILVNGAGGQGASDNNGVILIGTASNITSTDSGTITINGTGGNGTGNSNTGISIQSSAVIKATGSGSLTLVGNGGTGTSQNKGVEINGSNTQVSTTTGALNITGSGDITTTGSANFGIHINNTALVETINTGIITMNGTGGAGTNNNEGVRFEGAGTIIRSNGGGMNLTGTGGDGSTQDNIGLFLLNGSLVEDTATGTLNITGTGGNGTNQNKGIVLFGNTSTLRTNGGGMNLNGFASTTATGLNNSGVSNERGTITDLNGGTITISGTGGAGSGENNGIILTGNAGNITATGAINLTGTAGTGSSRGVGILNNNTTKISTVGDVFLTTVSGPFTTPAGTSTNNLITATNLIINGETRTGFNANGILAITAATFLSSTDQLTIDISGSTIPGTDYDQLQITGVVDVTGATLNLVDNIAGTIPDNTEIIIITNDGSDSVIGQFVSSNADGFNGQRLRIIYDAGDGNDIAIIVGIPNVEVVAGDLIIKDNLERDDNITITINGANYRVTDPDNELIAGDMATQVDANTVDVAIASVTGEILTTTLGGNDDFTPDFSGGNFNVPINYDGGTEFDTMGLTGVSPGGTFDTVEHTFVNNNDGSISISGNSLISYEGLEPITDNLDVDNRVFTFTSALDENIVLNAAGTLDNRINSSVGGELVDFTNPNNSLTINTETAGGAGLDVLSVQGLNIGFDANLTINSGDDDITAFEVNDTNVGSGNVTVFSDVISAFATLSTTGNIDFTSQEGIGVTTDGVIESTNGNITFNAGIAPEVGDTFRAIVISGGGIVQTTGSGNINLTGTSFGIGDFFSGIEMGNAGTVQATGSGSISLVGNGANNGTIVNAGITILDNSTIRSNGGGITMNGTGGGTPVGEFNDGIAAFDNVIIEDINGGGISISGQAGDGTGIKAGIYLAGPNTFVRSTDGTILFNGTSSAGTDDLNDGVLIEAGAVVEATGLGMITIDGMGGAGVSENSGVSVFGTATVVRSNEGTIIIDGTAGGNETGTQNYGVLISNGALVQKNNTGEISITGTGGAGVAENHGIQISDSSISSNTGNISLDGTAATADDIGINFFTENSIVNTGGDVTLDATTGPIVTPAGIPTNTLVSGTNVIINGEVSSGNDATEGSFAISGNTALSSGDELSISVNDFNNFGSDYDQIAVTGMVDVTGATLTLVDNTSETGELCDEMTIIVNDGADAIVGEFAGAAEGTDLNFNGELWRISYVGGDGNDVVLAFNSGMVAEPICMNITLQLDANGTPITITPADVDGGTPMGCDFDNLSIDMDTFDCSNVGPNNVVLTVTDIFGNTNSCTAIVTVEDNLAPVITCASSDARDTDPGVCTYDVVGTEFDATATDNCSTFTITNNINGTNTLAGTTLPLGATVITWTVDDGNGQMDSCTTTVTVEDNEAPTITCADYSRSTDPNVCQYTVAGTEFDSTFSDNCTTAIITNDYNNAASLDGAVFPQGDTVVTWTVDDGNGQTATCVSTVTINDIQAPTIGCVGDFTVSTGSDSCSAVVTFATPSVIDNCSSFGDITIVQTVGIMSGGSFPRGNNLVGFTATDAAGNSSFCSFTVMVVDNTAPIAMCQDATVTLDSNGMATITAGTINNGSSDNCNIASSSIDITSFTCDDIGANTVTLTVTDTDGNTATCSAIVTVVDSTAPTAICQDITVALGADGTVTLDGSLIDNGSSDVCGTGALTFTTDPAVLTCTDLGQNFVDLIVTDDNGNSSTCTAVVTVEDNTDPILVCQDTTIELGADGTATIDPMQLLDMTNPLDNCTLDTLTVDIAEVTCNDVGGSIDITVFAADGSGNFSSCVATITVVDTSGPVFDQASLPQGPLTRMIDPATGFYRLEDFTIGVNSTDNCSLGLLPIEVNQFPFIGTPLDEGTYDITLTAMDEQGNETDYVFALIVEPALGVEDTAINLSTITMYPNPASDRVFLSNPQNIPLRDVQIFDLTGRLVQKVDLSEALSETIIDLSNLQSATYMFIISTDKVSRTKQMIKE
ncbi:HYR domain-containing protein [Jejudonia soesokkakensis]|uniref:HYR domain-containing protein n=1 Tax=Jejudonia soesokkakensis TaxID=1323432 RepID=A0ABW2N019_9FLAO